MDSTTTDKELVIQQLVRHIDCLSHEQAEKISEFSQEKVFAGGNIIFEEEDLAIELYLLLEGVVILTGVGSLSVGKINLALLGPSEFFGWSAVAPPHQESATAEAMQLTKVIAINGRKLLTLCNQEPELGYMVMHRLFGTVANRLRTTRAEIFSRYC